MMNTFDDLQAEERAALENERAAFRKRQAAFFQLMKQFTPKGDGAPPAIVLDEWESADKSWKVANAKFMRIADEIRTGKRP